MKGTTQNAECEVIGTSSPLEIIPFPRHHSPYAHIHLHVAYYLFSVRDIMLF